MEIEKNSYSPEEMLDLLCNTKCDSKSLFSCQTDNKLVLHILDSFDQIRDFKSLLYNVHSIDGIYLAISDLYSNVVFRYQLYPIRQFSARFLAILHVNFPNMIKIYRNCKQIWDERNANVSTI